MTEFPRSFPDPDQIRKFFESWWGTVSAIFVAIAGPLLALQIPSQIAYGVAAALTAIGLAAVVIMYRRDAKRASIAKVDTAPLSEAAAPGAFRGLRRFRRGEKLPGPQRRRDAAQLLAEVVRSDFKVAVVTGDSGAGKSSLLECALVEALEKAGHPVVMISNPSRLAPSGQAAGYLDIAPVLGGIDEQLKLKPVDASKPCVLILDQFEELLSRFREGNELTHLGDYLRGEISAGTRLVIGMRKEYLAEFKQVAARLGHVVSFEDTFLVLNFSVSEATEVIRECAARDGISADPELADLIARDLSVDGKVRPADLQVVCTALSGALSTARYRSEGGAAGLRSRFIRTVVDITGDAVLTRAVLRALCDIPNNKKAPEPMSAEAIAEQARAGAPGQRATPSAVASVLEALEQARVIVAIDYDGSRRWSLIHDYLVEPIKLATEEQTSRSEQAIARLEYFLGRLQTESRSTIPLSELRSIQRDAPPLLLKQHAARRLIRRSRFVGYGRPLGLLASAALVSTLILLAAATERKQWRVVSTSSHWDGVGGLRYGRVKADLVSSEGTRTLLTQTASTLLFPGPDRLTAWNAETGEIIWRRDGHFNVFQNSIWSYDEATGVAAQIDGKGMETWRQATSNHNRPKRPMLVHDFRDPFLIFLERERMIFGADHPGYRQVYDTKNNSWSHPMPDLIPWSALWHSLRGCNNCPPAAVGYKEGSAIKAENEPDHVRLVVFSKNYQRILLDREFEKYRFGGLFGIDNKIYLLTSPADVSATTIDIFNYTADIGYGKEDRLELIESRPLSLPEDLRMRAPSQIFKTDRGWALVQHQDTRTVLWPLSVIEGRFAQPAVSEGKAPQDVTYADARLGFNQARPELRENRTVVAWNPTGPVLKLMLWLEHQSAPLTFENIRVHATDNVTISRDLKRLLLFREEGVSELWAIDPSTSKTMQLARIQVDRPRNGAFGGDEQLVLIRQEGGALFAWDKDGAFLGPIATTGGEIVWSSYDPECRRVLLWTSEGQRLDIRRGMVLPLRGFWPERECSANKPVERRLLERIFDTVFG